LIGLDSFAMDAPTWLLTLAGGALADRANRRTVIAAFQSVQMLCPITIVVLLVAGAVQPWMIILLSVVVGVTDALSLPSFQSIVPSIVDHDQVSRGLALNSTQYNLSRILGPALAGLLMSGVGVMACFVVSAASYVPFIGVALWILPRRTAAPPRSGAVPQSGILEGVGEILRQPYPRGALLTVLASGMLCAPLITFSPVLVKAVFHGGAGRFSAALVAFGAGGLIGAAGLLGIAPRADPRRLVSGSALALGALVALSALNPWFWAMPPLLVLAGAAMTISNISANSLLQATASPRLLGRTVSLYMLAMRGGSSIGALVTGAAVSAIGAPHALMLDGAAAMAVQAAIGWFWLHTREHAHAVTDR
jgi:predicted MFS family arabinose efflux permease